MLFNTLWTILLGVIGGIVSSMIVSRVFFIHNEYQTQIKFIDGIIRKVGYLTAFLQSAKAIFEVSYDQDIAIKQEMKEKGYKCEMEYYAAHADKDWISKDDVLMAFHKEIGKTAKSIKDDLSKSHIEDTQLNDLMKDIMHFINEVSAIKEFTFSQINMFMKREQNIIDKYDACLNVSSKKMFGMVVSDKVMIALFIMVALIVVGAIAAFIMGI
ncbi:MAG: hypothetical protein IKK28_08015 [Mogibacterium sp.]|nr:hypothetical protein [Mogibacterium sp.]